MHKYKFFIIQALIVIFMPVAHGASDFALNFNLSGPAATQEGACVAGNTYTASSFCGGGTQFTNFSQDFIDVNGVNYWRNVVGDPASGFAMVFYTRGEGLSGVDGGGMELSKHPNDPRRTANALCDQPAFSSAGPCGNAVDPFGVYTLSGTGTNDPTRSVFRMMIDDGNGMSMEVYKPILNTKPKITQTLIDRELSAEFITDMRDLSYSHMDTAAEIVNNQRIDDPGLPASRAGDFDMMMVERSNVTAGRYTFIRGQGWGVDNGAGWEPNPVGTFQGWQATNSAFDYGVYDYAEGGFDVYNVDWASFFNLSDNAAECAGSRGTTAGMKSCPGAP